MAWHSWLQEGSRSSLPYSGTTASPDSPPASLGAGLTKLMAPTFPSLAWMRAITCFPPLSSGSQISSPLWELGRHDPVLPYLTSQKSPGSSSFSACLGPPSPSGKAAPEVSARAAPCWPPQECRPQAFSWGRERTSSLGAPKSGLGATSALCRNRGPNDKEALGHLSVWVGSAGPWESRPNFTIHCGLHRPTCGTATFIHDGWDRCGVSSVSHVSPRCPRELHQHGLNSGHSSGAAPLPLQTWIPDLPNSPPQLQAGDCDLSSGSMEPPDPRSVSPFLPPFAPRGNANKISPSRPFSPQHLNLCRHWPQAPDPRPQTCPTLCLTSFGQGTSLARPGGAGGDCRAGWGKKRGTAGLCPLAGPRAQPEGRGPGHSGLGWGWIFGWAAGPSLLLPLPRAVLAEAPLALSGGNRASRERTGTEGKPERWGNMCVRVCLCAHECVF